MDIGAQCERADCDNIDWPRTDGRFATELRQQWVDAVRTAIARLGITLAVVPLRMLAEPGGLLDQLDARGAEINGPAWR